MFSTQSTSYTKTAIFLHWLIALAILSMLAIGWSFGYLPMGSTKFFLIQLHKSIGITILLLSLIRLGWRLTHKAPPLPATMSLWEQRAAYGVHILLYALMILMPLSGWAMVSASPRGIPTILYGFLPWPNLPVFSTLPDKKAASDILKMIHGDAAIIFAVLIAGHAAAALKHHFISHDDILLRMLPSKLRGAKKLLLIFAVLFLSLPAQAKDWQLDEAASKLTFSGTQSGQKFEGGFKKFTAHISLDPLHPETGKIDVTIDTSSAYAGDPDRDTMLPQADWFNVTKFPQAHFTTTMIKKLSDGSYEAASTLTIKDITRPVSLTFTLSPEGDYWHAKGKATLMRNDFLIGQGTFSSDTYVKYPVDVFIDLKAKPLP